MGLAAKSDAESRKAGKNKPPFKERLKAWWEGYEYVDGVRRRKGEPVEEVEEPLPDDGEPTLESWPAARIAAVQVLFGEGMVRPCSEEAILKLIKPLGLNERMSAVELGAGLGGLTRYINRETQAYVQGYEADEDLAQAGNEMSTMAGLAKKAAVEWRNLDLLDPKPRSTDAVVSHEALLNVADKEATFKALRRMLKPLGHLMLTDFMLDGTDRNSPTLQAWAEKEPRPPHLLDIHECRNMLSACGFKVRIAEDITKDYHRWAIAAFADYADKVAQGKINDRLNRWILNEGELWARRLSVMEKGELKVFRIYANAPADVE